MANRGPKKGSAARILRPLHPRDEVKLGRRNLTLLAIALGVIVIGYVFLAIGSITIAPLLLVAGYCVLLPWAILAREPGIPGHAAGVASSPQGTGPKNKEAP